MMSTQGMIERVEKAIADEIRRQRELRSGQFRDPDFEPDLAKCARAAIAALREPTPAMTDAGHWAIREAIASNGNMTTYSDGDHAWQAMIDAILSEQERA